MNKVRATVDATNAIIQDIRAFHELGQRLRRPSDQQADCTLPDGRQLTAYRLDVARLFAKRYSEEELDELCDQLRQHRPAFSLSHVGILITIRSSQRRKLQVACIKKNWSNSELIAAKQKRCKKRGSGGRRPQVTADTAVVQFHRQSNRFRRLCARVCKPYGKAPPIMRRLSPALQRAIEAVREGMISLGQVVEEELRKTQRDE